MKGCPSDHPLGPCEGRERNMAEHIHGGVVIEIRAATGSREGHVVSETTYPGGPRPARPPACRACALP